MANRFSAVMAPPSASCLLTPYLSRVGEAGRGGRECPRQSPIKAGDRRERRTGGLTTSERRTVTKHKPLAYSSTGAGTVKNPSLQGGAGERAHRPELETGLPSSRLQAGSTTE